MNARQACAVLLLLASLLAVTAHFSTTTLEYSRYNIQWNGTSELFGQTEERGAEMIDTYTDLSGEKDALLLIIAPASNFTPDETAEVRRFLAGGGTVVIADEEGRTNGFLAALGSGIRVVPGNLTSVDMEFSDPRTVLAYHASGADDTLTEGVAVIICNRPATVAGGTALITTSMLSWTDEDGNLRVDGGETLARYGVLATEPIENGTLYVLADASLFINGMQGIDRNRDNHRLIDNILTNRPQLLVDQVHSGTASADGILALANTARSSSFLAFAALWCTVIGLAAAFYRRLL